ncbi:hypothetical protein SAMN06265222_101352 [Neorhodopirellula lusitana]|uniref:Uncharacterized protein n=1 Tax=Neorhodopirellula lusitana TaxID=445327 RepID=A0ABY1PQ09_9BACT|nr:hypothetical protein SAMN06265222_101352 [Neorhodopirellula lusitana]
MSKNPLCVVQDEFGGGESRCQVSIFTVISRQILRSPLPTLDPTVWISMSNQSGRFALSPGPGALHLEGVFQRPLSSLGLRDLFRGVLGERSPGKQKGPKSLRGSQVYDSSPRS